jgi:hypothetical protein
VSGLRFHFGWSVVVGLRWAEMDVSELGHINGGGGLFKRSASENGGIFGGRKWILRLINFARRLIVTALVNKK